ncbi:type I secretion system permease/ATPase [Caldimonas tepidiphila]|uniref:type I secretion system permease/ATPase n=1 Tax=Caldimonas tepidiphila TaxID=2315841 RepID=UPI000E5B9F76|nr:type I secretion system permease/ATPase [Caldimonas tepidiphila]
MLHQEVSGRVRPAAGARGSRAGPTAHDSTGELRAALGVCRHSFVMAGFFSLFINLLMLAPVFYMLEVYDRVLPSSGEATLLMLTLLVLFLFAVMGALDWVRSQILIAVSARIDGTLGPRVFDGVFARGLQGGGRGPSAQPLGDLMQLRQFLTGAGLLAFFDAPWVPVYIAVMFLFHPVFGAVGLASAGVLLALALWGELRTRADLEQATQVSQEISQHTQQQLRNAEVIEALGMLPRLRERWAARQAHAMSLQMRASRRGGAVGVASKMFRLAIQSLILGLGAWLAIRGQITGGSVIAGSILLGRALAPLDLIINGWRGFQGARGAYRRLEALLAALPRCADPMALPAPQGALALEQLTVQPAGAEAPLLRNVSLALPPGASLAIVGPSGAGKSTLLRAMLGLHEPASGSVRLDGAELAQWSREQLGRHVGYLPQDVELLDGTVAENISRFGPAEPERVLAAARAAGVHEIILRLPQGYETWLSSGGQALSAGQRQRIGLARALYGAPCLVVLDEPNANLDQDGELALAQTLRHLKAQGQTVVVTTHRPGLLAQMELLAVVVEGQLTRFGPRETVLAAIQQPVQRVAAAGA